MDQEIDVELGAPGVVRDVAKKYMWPVVAELGQRAPRQDQHYQPARQQENSQARHGDLSFGFYNTTSAWNCAAARSARAGPRPRNFVRQSTRYQDCPGSHLSRNRG